MSSGDLLATSTRREAAKYHQRIHTTDGKTGATSFAYSRFPGSGVRSFRRCCPAQSFPQMVVETDDVSIDVQYHEAELPLLTQLGAVDSPRAGHELSLRWKSSIYQPLQDSGFKSVPKGILAAVLRMTCSCSRSL